MTTIIGMILILSGIYGLAAMSALFSERSGTINIFVNGGMIMGAFSYVAVTYTFTENGTALNAGHVILGLITGIAVSIVFTSLLAIASINFKGDQVVVGIALAIIAPIASLIGVLYLTSGQITVPTSSIQIITSFKLIGWKIQVIFGVCIILFIVFLWWSINFTRFGLRLTSAGENPHSLAASGVSVIKTRHIGLLISGALSGFAGAVAVSSFDKFSSFDSNVLGIGFIALGILIIGQWRTVWVMLASIGFSIIYSLVQYYGIKLENEKWLLFSIPYVSTILVLPFVAKYSRAPKFIGIPYQRL